MNNLYWNVYKNLERELIALSDVIHIDDAQLGVYSMKIADLLVRTVVEIETISKELYFIYGGAKPNDNNLFFDTDCLKLLDDILQLSMKVVMVSSPVFDFKNEENIRLTPLYKAHKRGSSSSLWQRAYQAVKHNRAKELRKGNLKNFISALAALYVLNLYYNDQSFDIGKDSKGKSFDANVGSLVFSVEVHPFRGISTSDLYAKEDCFEKYTYLIKATDESQKVLTDVFSLLESDISIKLMQQALNDGVKPDKLSAEFQDYCSKNRSRILVEVTKENRRNLARSLGSLRYEVVLNKNQY